MVAPTSPPSALWTPTTLSSRRSSGTYGGTNITPFRLVDPNNPLVVEVVRYLQLWQDLHLVDLEDFRYGGNNIFNTFNHQHLQ
jgi:hypothetical protein